MASLTQVAISTRKIVRYSIYLVIALIIARIVLSMLSSFLTKFAPPPPPTITFGKLDKLPFPTSKDLPQLTYTLETADGNLPTFSTQAKVYFMPQQRADLLSLDNAKTKASSLGYTLVNRKQSDSLYDFGSANGFSTLEMNIVTGTFFVSYDLRSDPTPISLRAPTADAAVNVAKSLLSTAGILPDDLSGPVTPEFIKIQNNQLVTALSLSEANFIKINLFRKDYDKLPAVTQSFNGANVWFLVGSSSNSEKQIIQAQYYYYPVDETQFSTYPIKTAAQAYKELQAGNGYIANLGDNQNGKITIRRVYLAYYDAGKPSQYYQPVIVFEGDNGFAGYVPAVTSTYYSE